MLARRIEIAGLEIQLRRVQLDGAAHLFVTGPRGCFQRNPELLGRRRPLASIGVRHTHVVARPRTRLVIAHALVSLQRGRIG